ncbi:MAG: hypothetical protein RAK22_02400, partial [Nanoarchaeota archaeon]|nr:hypothetical protein [Nanoarchaeota archaeon]
MLAENLFREMSTTGSSGQEKKRKRNLLWAIIVVVIVIIAGAGGGYYYYGVYEPSQVKAHTVTLYTWWGGADSGVAVQAI